ncbi:lysophospholipid acyltransferase family protein [Malaciobacter molluscorum]|uniref:lysophospholipid acyltransferase family protein n=1 Tax=Malaciobacter molluscorum TaxID=1032072 RepID=UPI001D1810A1|nr:lysophospholipid acyltransferase family protein [Malaciobacter molluscorum]
MIKIFPNLKKIKIAIYAMYLTNKYGVKLKKSKSSQEKMNLRLEYSLKLLDKLNIKIDIVNKEQIPKTGQYLLVSNHRSIIDPLIIEIALKNSAINGFWVAKKELYNSLFFGSFTRNAGCILIDRESNNMSEFFKRTKEVVKEGHSIFIFPEGTRNTTTEKLSDFKDGSKLIALKNRLNILPVFIKDNADEILKDAINNDTKDLTINVQIGEVISYRDKQSLKANYKKQFNI